MRTRVSKAFTLVEILIVVVILGILAAIVIPQFTSASEEAQVGNVQTQLATVRGQIELFRVRNNGQSPVMGPIGAEPNWSDLLCGAGNTHDPAMLQNSFLIDQEPYLKKAPVNPRNKLSTVTVHATNAAAQAASIASDAVTNGVGWHYDSTSGNIYAAGFDEANDEWIPAP